MDGQTSGSRICSSIADMAACLSGGSPELAGREWEEPAIVGVGALGQEPLEVSGQWLGAGSPDFFAMEKEVAVIVF